MKLEVYAHAAAVAVRGASLIAEAARAAYAARHRCIVALSGGKTPAAMFRALAEQSLPWDAIHLVQVDERVAPADGPDRNLTDLCAALVSRVGLPATNLHAMPVDSADLSAAAAAYGESLKALAGEPPVIDLVHLGLGADGHTASLVPGDPVLQVTDSPVAVTGPYQGHRRMTLTYPVLGRARRVLFVVTGGDKASALLQLLRHDGSIPAGRIAASDVVVLCDEQAASKLDRG